MKKLVFLLMALLVASSAFAVVDPDPNMMGMYFDLSADTVCINASPFTPQTAYLIVTNPSFDALYGFEAGITLEGTGLVTGVTFANPQALNVGTPTNMIVGFGAPSATSEATLLATIAMFYTDATGGALGFRLHGTEPSSMDPAFPVVLLAGGELMSYGLSAADGLVAQINGDCAVVATEEISFDSVKSLYR